MLKAVIFDMDGLMFDTETIAKKGWKEVGKELGFTVTDKMLEEVTGLDVENTRKVFLSYLGDDFDYYTARNKRYNYSISYMDEHGVPVKKGLMELLEFLKDKGIKCAVATSTAKVRAEYNLKSTDVLKFFDAVVCGDMIERGKPEPDIFLKAAELLDSKPSECIVLEDSPNGILAAYRGGFRAVMVPDLIEPDENTESMLNAKCDSLTDVIDLVLETLK